MQIVVIVAGVLFGAGALCAVYRIIRGPTVLDRVVASDVLVATVICALGVRSRNATDSASSISDR